MGVQLYVWFFVKICRMYRCVCAVAVHICRIYRCVCAVAVNISRMCVYCCFFASKNVLKFYNTMVAAD